MEKEIIVAILFVCIGVYMSITRTKALLGYLIAMIGFFIFVEGLSKRERRKADTYDEEKIIKEYQKID
ncbi:MAG TPA: hypothetical protein ENI50_01435 [Euryarchaeota archaeon]|nr:MAG: hypothetical protein DRN45_00605 [Thermococci archaeon]HEC95670.1 hypothetical protein [Euryarchaeota archaeon]